MKTDDRMRLAKERREERERSLGKLCPVLGCGGSKLKGFLLCRFPVSWLLSLDSLIGYGRALSSQ